MQQDVKSGKTLWEAMMVHENAFSPLYVSMVKAGESSGQLASVLSWLAEYQEKEQARRMQIRSALAYPTLLAIAGLLAVTLLIVLVVPKFAAMFTEFNQALPLPTIILLGTAGFIGHWGWIILVVLILGGTLFSRYAKTTAGKLRVDGWRLRVPLFSKLLVRSAMSRFARTTATLMQGGVPLLSALSVVRDVMDNEVLARATDRAREGMREGERFAARLEQTGVFPPFLTHMIGIGEETGDLHSMLLTVANTYDIEVENTLKGMVSLIEPVVIIIIGSMIGFIVFSMLLPIFSINMTAG
jgi:general secretion pathway protein F